LIEPSANVSDLTAPDAVQRPPMHGIRVLERTTSAAGQTAGMLLADLGADVVRVIPDDVSASIDPHTLPSFLCWNRGKTFAAVDEFDRLLGLADILLVDDRPTGLHESGLDAATLRRRAPTLGSVWMPATAPTGRWSELPHDQLLLDAISGFAAHHPATSERPVASVVPTRHLVQGALAGVAAIAGLIGRERDGWGRAATVSGLHAEAAALSTLVSRSVDGPPVVSPGKLLPLSPNFRLFQGGDGRWLFLAALSPDLFIKALEVLDRLDILAHPDIAGDFMNVMRPDVGITIGAELDAAFAHATVDEWQDRFQAAGVPVALVGDPADWLGSDVVAHACPPVMRSHPDIGEVIMPGIPVVLSAHPGAVGEVSSAPTPQAPVSVWAEALARLQPDGPPPAADDQPLAGLRVVDLSTFLAAPFVTTLFAAYGADVVKVEGPDGDPYAVFNAPYSCVNEHKQRLTLDLTDESARLQLLELAGAADVVVDNLIASSLARLQLPPERFDAANPSLVRCSVTAYGADGPYAELPGFDPIMQSLSGLVSIQGGAGRPIAMAAPVHDIATGCVAALGTLAALWVRDHSSHAGTSQGQRVFASLAATSTYLQSAELTTFTGRPPRPVGGPDFAGPNAFEHFYRASDRWLAISAVTADERVSMLDQLGLRTDAGNVTAVEPASIDPGSVAAVIASRSCDDWVDRLSAAGVPCCASINRVELDDPFLVEHNYSHVVDIPHVGRLEVVSGYTDWHNAERRPPLPVAELRTDGISVLRRWAPNEEKSS
jgi:crotonobetainyl-CoA:carnitine CoA-transferase CaiB-like acyl-CoA transferase